MLYSCVQSETDLTQNENQAEGEGTTRRLRRGSRSESESLEKMYDSREGQTREEVTTRKNAQSLEE